MPTAAPFPSPTSGSAHNALFPALYLYPLNDTWAPKHIALTNQHTKIGRQTSSKTAPGERNGFFDSKVLSRQHAEVWEEGGKIFIKDVKSSNGTFINGERLSSEGHESEPFELKSDDIVEFGIDIVGEDNKTIIHHKVAARVVCVFSEQDAQVAARAEQHQQQHQLQQQQYLQQAASASGSSLGGPGGPPGGVVNGGIVGGTIGVGGVAGGPQNFPFAAQRRAQLAQQGLGGMGGMRPPGKSGLSFDVILSRLQGELQKSRETGAELNSLNGAMNEIHDTLGGTLPTSLPMFPSTLPPVRPPQEAPPPPVAGSSHASPEQPPSQSSSAVSASAVLDLQSQLRDTQSSLASHLDKVRALEGVIAEQEAMKREVRTLREVMEERRREMDLERAQQEERIRREIEEARRPPDLHRAEQEQEPRGGFDLEDEEDEREDDEDDDTRSVSTIMAHELERVEEEDEEQLAEDERQQERQDVESGRREKAKEGEAQFEAEAQAEEEERRREDLGVGRPRTPEPTRLGLLGASVPRRASLSSPLSQVSSSELRNGTTPDDVYEQVVKLSKQVGAVMALTSSLEAQHSAAQGTIQALETKVESLETMLRAAEEALAKAQQPQAPPPAPKEVVEVEGLSLVDKMAEWKKAVEGQWGTVQEEWTHERERLSKAREEWESKLRQVDSGLEKMASLQSTLTTQQQQIQVQLQHHQQLQQSSMHSFHHIGNGDILKHNGGLVTPPSPRSQSSDSGRYRRRRRRSSGSRGRSSSGERAATGSVEGDDDPDTDATLASSVEDEIEAKLRLANGKILGSGHAAERSLATPEPSVYKLSSSLGSLYADPNSKVRSNSEDTHASIGSLSSSPLADSTTSANDADSYSVPPPNINMQTAVGVLILSVAAAAVFWKVKPE